MISNKNKNVEQMSDLSKTQIDKLGERLKKDEFTETDLRLLDEYRLSFSEAYRFVLISLGQHLNLELTGRPAKSTPSIIDKLRRESIRLTQIQDIAGCRIVVSDIQAQDNTSLAMKNFFKDVALVDRRIKPSHGYRAVHLVVNHQAKLVEIQIRTALQHLWAELSEKLSDQVDPRLKYGGGDKLFLELLDTHSLLVAKQEEWEVELARTQDAIKEARTKPGVDQQKLEALREQLLTIQGSVESSRTQVLQTMSDVIDLITSRKG